jgi:hypothetical protein
MKALKPAPSTITMSGISSIVSRRRNAKGNARKRVTIVVMRREAGKNVIVG